MPDIRVMSFNVRVNGDDGGYDWSQRRDFVTDTMVKFNPDFIGVQEMEKRSRRQYIHKRLTEGLGKKYKTVSRGRRRDEEGELTGIFYDVGKFKLVRAGHFYLSSTPDVMGSVGWPEAPGQEEPKLVNWGKFRLRSDPSVKILVFNAHFDNNAAAARPLSAKLVVDRLALLGKKYRKVVMGDFNAGDRSRTYSLLLRGSGLVDTYRARHPERGPNEGTQARDFKAKKPYGKRKDWILASTDWAVKAVGVDRSTRDGRTASDHFAVTAILQTT